MFEQGMYRFTDIKGYIRFILLNYFPEMFFVFFCILQAQVYLVVK